ncbi:MAG: 6-carboxytetrahydropterin synthase [Phycisphaeraceae bacterium]|nr:6-carboxytetrahydropterin synthase [Phycisphaeraceae bacterium]
MHLLTRSVRFAINDGPSPAGSNGYAGNPPISGFGRWFELLVTCRGKIDQKTGYLIDIKTVDAHVRRDAVPLIQSSIASGDDPFRTLAPVVAVLSGRLPAALERVRLRLTPYHDIEMASNQTTHALIRQRFDFSAAHRLHSPALSDAENQKLYGKCNNPRGHGHNYVVQPVVKVRIDAVPAFSLRDLESITDDAVVKRFDHKHLNEDTDDFSIERGGVLPSVENIARICFERLAPVIAAHPASPSLERVTVWETDRTSATYPG